MTNSPGQTSRLRLLLVLAAGVLLACAAQRQVPLGDPSLGAGRYLTAYYRSPEFEVGPGRWRLPSWELGEISGLSRELAGQLLQDEIAAALADNGLLSQDHDGDFMLTGTVQRLRVASPFWRWLSGRGTVILEVRGELRRHQEVLFAFHDAVKISPPINPSHRPTSEPELLARLALRQFAVHLLNELLLPEKPAPAPQAP